MQRTNLALVVTAVAFIATSTHAQPATPASAGSQPGPDQAQSQGHWYYCDPAKAYYPSVSTCPIPWRAVTPIPSSEHAPAHLPTADGSDQAQVQPPAPAPAQAPVDRAAYEASRAIEVAKSRGYELIPSVKDLILDGKDLAAGNAKIQITGIYKKEGDGAVLYGDEVDLFSNSDHYVPVLTEDAARPVREALLNYSCENVGCRVEVGGHMTMCQHLFLLMKDYPEVPCLNIEVMIVYRPGD